MQQQQSICQQQRIYKQSTISQQLNISQQSNMQKQQSSIISNNYQQQSSIPYYLIQQAYSQDNPQYHAILSYLALLITIPGHIYDPNHSQQSQLVILFGLPITLPIALIGAPLFFVSRQAKLVTSKLLSLFSSNSQSTYQNQKDKIQQQQQTYFDPKNKVQKYIKQGQTYQNKLSEQTWKKAIQDASNELLLKKKLRLVVANERSTSYSNNKSAKQFMFIIKQDTQIWQIGRMINMKINSSSDSIVLMYDKTILNSYMKISDVTFNALGVVKLSYATMETFG